MAACKWTWRGSFKNLDKIETAQEISGLPILTANNNLPTILRYSVILETGRDLRSNKGSIEVIGVGTYSYVGMWRDWILEIIYSFRSKVMYLDDFEIVIPKNLITELRSFIEYIERRYFLIANNTGEEGAALSNSLTYKAINANPAK